LLKEKPDVIISTGAEIGIPAIFWGRLLCKKTIFIETVTRFDKPTVSGRTSGTTVVNVAVPEGEENLGTWVGRTVPVRVLRAGPHSVFGEACLSPEGQGV
jgi:UDP-N-acetylglucosamine:LPS N-acetylglucosamine transferase